MRHPELRLPIALALACAIAAGGTALARAVRHELDKSTRYAATLAHCANGGWFRIGTMYVSCGSVDIPGR